MHLMTSVTCQVSEHAYIILVSFAPLVMQACAAIFKIERFPYSSTVVMVINFNNSSIMMLFNS